MADFAARRLELDEILRSVLGSKNVYFQPPENLKMKFPCIVYNLANARLDYADNRVYMRNRRYEVTFISDDPVSSVPDTLIDTFQHIGYDRRFVSDNMYHDVFTVYY